MAGLCLLAVLVLATFLVLRHDSAAPSSSTGGCRDYTADIRAFTVGRMCWKSGHVRVSGYLRNPDGPGDATLRLCASNSPGECLRTLKLAVAAPGRTTDYNRKTTVPPGYGNWVRVCVNHHCTSWE